LNKAAKRPQPNKAAALENKKKLSKKRSFYSVYSTKVATVILINDGSDFEQEVKL